MEQKAAPSHPLVLVVEDDSGLRDMLKLALALESIPCLIAENGNKALDILRAQHVDVVLSDVRMPECGGLELLDEIRALKYSARVILMTGFADVTREEALERGAQELLSKPFDLSVLVSTLLHSS